MKRKYLVKCFLCLMLFVNGLTVLYAAPPKCPVQGDWNFVAEFSDEFDGTTLDANKWWDFNPAWVGRTPAFFSRDNVAVKDGFLQLTARCIRPEELTVENKARGFDKFTTAIVKSKKRVKYGYFEARFKSMKAGVCNALWLYDPLEPEVKYREGEGSEEIDIFEVFGKPEAKSCARIYYTTVHRYCTPYVESIVNKKKTKLPKYSGKYKVDYDFWADYHVAGLLWTPKEIKWYLDGKEVFSRPNDIFQRGLHIMIDCEIMRDWVGDPDPKDLPSVFSIDYIRVWQMK